MEDSSLIASLTAYDKNDPAIRAIELGPNALRYSGPPLQRLADQSSRASTIEPDPNEIQPRLRLGFDLPPKSGSKFVFGFNPTIRDIILPHIGGISNTHCFMYFNERRELILESKRNTSVSYDNQGDKQRAGFKWILENGSTVIENPIVLTIFGVIKFLFQVRERRERVKASLLGQYFEYIDKLNSADDLPLHGLDLKSGHSTIQPSGNATAISKDAILVGRKEIGRGRSSTVTRVWDVSTGVVYAVKRFFEPSHPAEHIDNEEKVTHKASSLNHVGLL